MKNTIKTILLLTLILIGTLSACETRTEPPLPTDSTSLIKFSSDIELRNYLLQSMVNSISAGDYFGGRGRNDIMMMDSMEMSAAPSMSKAGASEYSSTNVQVKGVDEADIIKNDGKYIYMLSGNKLLIIDAYPAEDGKIIFEKTLDGNPRNLFLNNDRLIVFMDSHKQTFTIPEFDFAPRQTYSSVTNVVVYDVSDREKPIVEYTFDIDGNYFQSRMIGDYVYFVSQQHVDSIRPLIPRIMEDGVTLLKPDVYHFDNPEQNFNFNTVTSFNVNDKAKLESKTFMMGYAHTLYVSEDNIYISYQKSHPWRYYEQNSKERFFEVIVPLLPLKVRSQMSKSDSWDTISSKMEDMYNSMDEKDKKELMSNIQESLEEYDVKQEIERSKSIIHRIAIDNGDIDYKAKGEVPGSLLNQFSLDEKDGNLRVATTTNIWVGKSQMYNNVFVLDNDLDIIGKIEDIAPDERIYSARFMGDRLYMVTFKNIDPFFVIDLSNPRKPEILGELKIPGFSDYLHPYDEHHIIGLGKETEGNQWGGVSTKGLKLALFDVSDVKNPKQVSKIEIGSQGTDSEALHEHKAFLFDKENDLLVIPVREVKDRIYDDRARYYRWDVWQGAYVFSVKDGFKIRGKIAHNEGKEDNYWGSPYAVRRALYMDDVLYTMSPSLLMMSHFDGKEIHSLKLPYDNRGYYRY